MERSFGSLEGIASAFRCAGFGFQQVKLAIGPKLLMKQKLYFTSHFLFSSLVENLRERALQVNLKVLLGNPR